MSDWLGSLVNWFSDTASSAGNAIGDAASSVGNAVGDVGKGAADLFSGAASEGGADIGGAISNAGADVGGGIAAQDYISSLDPHAGESLNFAGNTGYTPQASTLALPEGSTIPGKIGAGDTSGGGINAYLEKLLGKGTTGGDVIKNISGLTALGGLGAQALRNNKPSPYSAELNKQAAGLNTIGTQLTDPLLKGTALPPGAKEGIDRSAVAQKAAIRSKYASLGMSGSSSEMADLNAIEQGVAAQTYSVANQLATEGLNAMGMSNTEYNKLASDVLSQDAQFSQALAALAGTLGGSKGSKVP